MPDDSGEPSRCLFSCLPFLSAYFTWQEDFTAGMHLDGYIHTMSFNQEGSQLAVAFGQACDVVLLDQDKTDFGALLKYTRE
jgi:hypothetical protein